MAKLIHTATGPNGETLKRTSATKRYSHVIISRPSYETALARAADRTNDLHNFAYYASYLDGTCPHLERGSWERDDAKFAARVADDIAKAKAMLDGATSAAEWADRRAAARVAIVEANKAAGDFDKWGALGWASRLSLAQKAASTEAGKAWHAEVRIIPCEVAGG